MGGQGWNESLPQQKLETHVATADVRPTSLLNLPSPQSISAAPATLILSAAHSLLSLG